MKSIIPVTLTVLIALNSCSTEGIRIESGFRGYKATAGLEGTRYVVLEDTTSQSRCALSATDYNKDGRFDEISLRLLPHGHPLEKHANLDTLETTYKEVMGRD